MEFCRMRKCPFEDCERLADYRTNKKYIHDRINRMTTGDAYIIFQNIDNPDISAEEKAAAIHEIAGMETHNGVTKAMMLKVIRWLWSRVFEITEEE